METSEIMFLVVKWLALVVLPGGIVYAARKLFGMFTSINTDVER